MQFVKRLFAQRYDCGQPCPKHPSVCHTLLIGNFAQQLYNTVDAMVVGHYISDAALGAVGPPAPCSI